VARRASVRRAYTGSVRGGSSATLGFFLAFCGAGASSAMRFLCDSTGTLFAAMLAADAGNGAKGPLTMSIGGRSFGAAAAGGALPKYGTVAAVPSPGLEP